MPSYPCALVSSRRRRRRAGWRATHRLRQCEAQPDRVQRVRQGGARHARQRSARQPPAQRQLSLLVCAQGVSRAARARARAAPHRPAAACRSRWRRAGRRRRGRLESRSCRSPSRTREAPPPCKSARALSGGLGASAGPDERALTNDCTSPLYAVAEVPEEAIACTWKSSLTRSSGAVAVRAITPASPPAAAMRLPSSRWYSDDTGDSPAAATAAMRRCADSTTRRRVNLKERRLAVERASGGGGKETRKEEAQRCNRRRAVPVPGGDVVSVPGGRCPCVVRRCAGMVRGPGCLAPCHFGPQHAMYALLGRPLPLRAPPPARDARGGARPSHPLAPVASSLCRLLDQPPTIALSLSSSTH